MTGPAPALSALVEQGVEFVVIRGVAALARGSALVTQDLDICYNRSAQNMERLIRALAPLQPRLRGGPGTTAWRFDLQALKNGMNFTLETASGDVDLVGEVAGVGQFSDVLAGSTELELFGVKCRVASLKTLIASKRAAGRTKDLLVLPELEALLEMNPEGE